MRKIKWPKIGQYVLVTRWQDKSLHDPWYVGFIYAIIIRKESVFYKVKGSNREWYHCFKISKDEGTLRLSDAIKQDSGVMIKTDCGVVNDCNLVRSVCNGKRCRFYSKPD